MGVALLFDNRTQRRRWEELARDVPTLANALDRVFAAGAPRNPEAVFALGATISGNQRSFQIGIMVNIPIAPIAGFTSGSTRR